MKKVANDIYGYVYEPKDINQFFSVLLNDTLNNHRTVRMWRGQEDISWPVHSAAYRRLTLTSGRVVERDVRYYEIGLLKRATHKGFRNSNNGPLADMELLALLQHHGAATRLVDFTRNAIVALYFACRGSPKKTGILIGIHTDTLGGYEGEPNTHTYEDYFADLEKNHAQYSQTWEPTAVSPRVAAQHSQFLYSPIVAGSFGSLAPGDAKYLFCVAIKPALKPLILRLLQELYGITQTSLFPDIDGFGHANSLLFDQHSTFRW